MILIMSLFVMGQSNKNEIDNVLADGKVSNLAYGGLIYTRLPNGYLLIKNPLVLKAKLKMFDMMFMPHPYQNMYQDIMLDLQSANADNKYWQKKYKKEKAKKIIWACSGIVLGVLSGIAVGKGILYVANK